MKRRLIAAASILTLAGLAAAGDMRVRQSAATRPASPATRPSKPVTEQPELIVPGDSPAAITRRKDGQPGSGAVRVPGGDVFTGRAISTLVNITYGDLPIILSCPHDGTSQPSGVPLRVDDGSSDFTTVRDTNARLVTEKVAAVIEQRLGRKPYVVIARYSRQYIDANRDMRLGFQHSNAAVHYWAYHQALQRSCDEVTRRFGRGLVIDIHGQGTDANAIFRGTRTGQSVGHLIDDFGTDVLIGPNSIIGQMQLRGYTFYPTPTATSIGTETQYNGGFITFAYGAQSQAHIDSIQFETGGNLRNTTAAQQKTGADLADSIAHFYRSYYDRTDNGPDGNGEEAN